MKKLLLVVFFVVASAGAFSWQRHQADLLRQRHGGLRVQLSENEQITSELERQNEAARARLEEKEAALRHQETQLAAVVQRAAASTHAASSTATNRWRNDVPFVRFSKAHLSSLTMGIIERDGANHSHLAPAAATLLGLSVEELSLVNEAIRTLCDQYLALELARAPPIPKYEGAHVGTETVFAIPRLASEGAELKSAFTAALTNALGPTRTELILNYGRDVFWRQLAGFGENTKTISLMAKMDEQGQEFIKAYANFQGPQNGGYTFKLSSDDPNAALARALWERAQAVRR